MDDHEEMLDFDENEVPGSPLSFVADEEDDLLLNEFDLEDEFDDGIPIEDEVDEEAEEEATTVPTFVPSQPVVATLPRSVAAVPKFSPATPTGAHPVAKQPAKPVHVNKQPLKPTTVATPPLKNAVVTKQPVKVTTPVTPVADAAGAWKRPVRENPVVKAESLQVGGRNVVLSSKTGVTVSFANRDNAVVAESIKEEKADTVLGEDVRKVVAAAPRVSGSVTVMSGQRVMTVNQQTPVTEVRSGSASPTVAAGVKRGGEIKEQVTPSKRAAVEAEIAAIEKAIATRTPLRSASANDLSNENQAPAVTAPAVTTSAVSTPGKAIQKQNGTPVVQTSASVPATKATTTPANVPKFKPVPIVAPVTATAAKPGSGLVQKAPATTPAKSTATPVTKAAASKPVVPAKATPAKAVVTQQTPAKPQTPARPQTPAATVPAPKVNGTTKGPIPVAAVTPVVVDLTLSPAQPSPVPVKQHRTLRDVAIQRNVPDLWWVVVEATTSHLSTEFAANALSRALHKDYIDFPAFRQQATKVLLRVSETVLRGLQVDAISSFIQLLHDRGQLSERDQLRSRLMDLDLPITASYLAIPDPSKLKPAEIDAFLKTCITEVLNAMADNIQAPRKRAELRFFEQRVTGVTSKLSLPILFPRFVGMLSHYTGKSSSKELRASLITVSSILLETLVTAHDEYVTQGKAVLTKDCKAKALNFVTKLTDVGLAPRPADEKEMDALSLIRLRLLFALIYSYGDHKIMDKRLSEWGFLPITSVPDATQHEELFKRKCVVLDNYLKLWTTAYSGQKPNELNSSALKKSFTSCVNSFVADSALGLTNSGILSEAFDRIFQLLTINMPSSQRASGLSFYESCSVINTNIIFGTRGRPRDAIIRLYVNAKAASLSDNSGVAANSPKKFHAQLSIFLAAQKQDVYAWQTAKIDKNTVSLQLPDFYTQLEVDLALLPMFTGIFRAYSASPQQMAPEVRISVIVPGEHQLDADLPNKLSSSSAAVSVGQMVKVTCKRLNLDVPPPRAHTTLVSRDTLQAAIPSWKTATPTLLDRISSRDQSTATREAVAGLKAIESLFTQHILANPERIPQPRQERTQPQVPSRLAPPVQPASRDSWQRPFNPAQKVTREPDAGLRDTRHVELSQPRHVELGQSRHVELSQQVGDVSRFSGQVMEQSQSAFDSRQVELSRRPDDGMTRHMGMSREAAGMSRDAGIPRDVGQSQQQRLDTKIMTQPQRRTPFVPRLKATLTYEDARRELAVNMESPQAFSRPLVQPPAPPMLLMQQQQPKPSFPQHEMEFVQQLSANVRTWGANNSPQHGRDNFPPQQRDNFPPQQRDNFPPQQRDNFPPQQRDNFPPQQRDNFPPQQRDSFPPQQRDSFPGPPQQQRDNLAGDASRRQGQSYAVQNNMGRGPSPPSRTGQQIMTQPRRTPGLFKPEPSAGAYRPHTQFRPF